MTTIKPGKLLLNFLEFEELIGKGYYFELNKIEHLERSGRFTTKETTSVMLAK